MSRVLIDADFLGQIKEALSGASEERCNEVTRKIEVLLSDKTNPYWMLCVGDMYSGFLFFGPYATVQEAEEAVRFTVDGATLVPLYTASTLAAADREAT